MSASAAATTATAPGWATARAPGSATAPAPGSATARGDRRLDRRVHGLAGEGRLPERERLPPLHRGHHEVVPDRGRDRAAEDLGHALDVLERDLALGVADPDARRELHGIAAEPGVDVVLRRPRLARGRPGPQVGRRPGPVGHDVLERVGHEVGDVLVDDLLARPHQVRVDPTAGPPHLEQRGRAPSETVVRERRVGVGHLQRVHGHAPERDRAHGREHRSDPQPVRHVHDGLRTDLDDELGEHGVDRVRGRGLQRVGAAAALRVHRLPGALGAVARGVVDRDRVGPVPSRVQVEALFHRRRQRERLERGAGLAPRPALERGEVHLRRREVGAAGHRQDLSGRRVDRHERRAGIVRARQVRLDRVFGGGLVVEVERRRTSRPPPKTVAGPYRRASCSRTYCTKYSESPGASICDSVPRCWATGIPQHGFCFSRSALAASR